MYVLVLRGKIKKDKSKRWRGNERERDDARLLPKNEGSSAVPVVSWLHSYSLSGALGSSVSIRENRNEICA